MIIPRSVLVRMKQISVKNCRENQNTYFMFNNLFFRKTCRLTEIMWKINEQPGRPQITIRRTSNACWTTKATNTHSEYVIRLSTATMVYEGASMLRYDYIVCFVCQTLQPPSADIQQYNYNHQTTAWFITICLYLNHIFFFVPVSKYGNKF
jgi:hypothetical protein